MRILFVTPDLEDNSLGRTYCLWLMAQHLGWDASVVSARGEDIWLPLRDSEFAAACGRLDVAMPPIAALSELASGTDMVVAVKPLDASFLLARAAARKAAKPLLLDIDDPDIEVRTNWLAPHQRIARWFTQPSRQINLRRARRLARRTPKIVSNPVLQRLYGGVVVPHVRPVRPLVSTPDDGVVRVAFVGSPKAHKGIDDLRSAVSNLAEFGYHLTVTGSRPADARDWETWTGTVSLAEGMKIVDQSDIIVIPSRPSSWARAQLPAKLIDAMMAGKAVVVTDVGPMRWAVGGAGLVTRPGDESSLTEALRTLKDPEVREAIGKKARSRAIQDYSVDSVAGTFRDVCEAARGRRKV